MASMQLRVPAALVALGVLAACSGERPRASGAADTSGVAAVTPDSAAMPVTNPATPAGHDTAATVPDTSAKSGASRQASPPSAPGATATKPATAPKPVPKKVAAAGQAKPKSDTATAAAPPAAGTTPSAAKPESTTTAPAAAKQDTASAEAESGGELRDAYHQAPRDTVSAAVYDGWKQFNLNCARCHGEDALGTTIAPHLIVSLKPTGPINTKELFVQTVCAGRPAKGMPAWCALGLDMDKIGDIYQYVKGRSDAKIGPGRPAVKREG